MRKIVRHFSVISSLVLILVMVLVLTSISHSADWLVQGASYDYKAFVFLDLGSVNCLGGGTASMWFKTVDLNYYNNDLETRFKAILKDMLHFTPQQLGEFYRLCDSQKTGYNMANIILDSKSRMFKGVVVLHYDGYGKFIKQTGGSDWLPISPEELFWGTLGVIKALCKE